MAREMKDSGVEWIGLIPFDWRLSKIGQLYSQRIEKVSDKDFPPLSVTMKGILPQLATAAKTDDGDNRKLVCKGDFCINSRSDRRGSCGISPYDGSVSLINIVLVPRVQMHPDYYDWLFHTSLFADEFYKWGHGIVDDLWTTRWQEMKSIVIPVPKQSEQTEIAKTLNRKCAEIDTIIEKTRLSIEEYQRLKQAIITRAVTKGICGNRPMKDSGIEWIGRIPDNYRVYRLKHILKSALMYGANESGVPFDESLPRYIRITDITTDGKLKETGKLSLHEEIAKEYILKENDILFARSGASVGKAFLYKELYGRSAFAGYLIKASVNSETLADYLFLYTQSSVYEEWKKQIFIQATIQNIGADRYNNLPVVLPPIQEQRELITYLNSKCAEINALIDQKLKMLSELEAYKKSLIYEYVTGKNL